MAEPDLVLQRVERNSLIACVAMAGAALAIERGRFGAPLGVLGGGVLAAISYRGIKSGIDVLVGAAAPASPSMPEGGGRSGVRIAIGLVKFFTRYAILAGAAYVIMARLRLPPVAVFAGASSLVVAIMFEALRSLRRH